MPRACRTMSFRWGGVAVAIAVALASGCSKPPPGPARFPMTGQITFDGKPVPRGTIAFEPDTQAGNSGPGGYGPITDGVFATHPRMGAVAGPQIVRIAGFDGKATAEMIDGKPLFPEYNTKVEVPEKPATLDFDVPRASAKKPKTAGPPGKPKQ
jgi:hypothetical protein